MVKYFLGGQEVRINGNRINKGMTTPWKINMEQQKWRFGPNDFSFSIGVLSALKSLPKIRGLHPRSIGFITPNIFYFSVPYYSVKEASLGGTHSPLP